MCFCKLKPEMAFLYLVDRRLSLLQPAVEEKPGDLAVLAGNLADIVLIEEPEAFRWLFKPGRNKCRLVAAPVKTLLAINLMRLM